MRTQVLAGALALVGSSAAFTDSSPYVLLSTAPLNFDHDASHYQSDTQVLENHRTFFGSCPTERYLLIDHFDISPTAPSAAAPLNVALADDRINGRYEVPEVVGRLTDASEMKNGIERNCELAGKPAPVVEVAYIVAPTPEDQDQMLRESLASVGDSESYTIIYFSNGKEPTYETEYSEDMWTDLKRDMNGTPERRQTDKDSDEWNRLPLFEKYQFFTPGIFMGLFAAVFLLSVFGVGLSALSSLEVSYGAFEKEMGPAAVKKQQ